MPVHNDANAAPPSPGTGPARNDGVVAFVGGGNMASALIGGLLASGSRAADILVVEPFEAQRARLAQTFGVQPFAAPDPRLARAGTVVWAVKPQQFGEAAASCAPFVGGALQLSVMAGIRSDAIARAAGVGNPGSPRVVRAMPNTPALIGRGIAGLFATAAVDAAGRARVEALLAPTGRTLWVQREEDLDAVTALSGSGPAYVFYVLEAMMEAAAQMGLGAEAARQLAIATFDGAAELARRSELPPEALRAQVTSKGGTTHAAITSLEADGVKAAFVKALLAAQQRARELGDAFGHPPA
ncbi:MAG: pyrroline-5-carboxylate reductase [Rubrivivax sp.]|nr:pyrroline-5-carboxylate reductase [Rubrivivax sp.]